MEFSTNRRLAVIVLIVVVCLFSVIGVNGSLAKLSDKIGQGFYDGVENRDGYVEKSIQSHLDNIADAANGLQADVFHIPEFAAQTLDVRVDRAGVRLAFISPELIHQLSARENAPGIA